MSHCSSTNICVNVSFYSECDVKDNWDCVNTDSDTDTVLLWFRYIHTLSLFFFLLNWYGYYLCLDSFAMEGFDGSCGSRDRHAKPDGKWVRGKMFRNVPSVCFLRTSKLGHLCASGSALWRASEIVKHVNFSQYWKFSWTILQSHFYWTLILLQVHTLL